MSKLKKYDELNNGYLSHGILARIYKIVDYIGYKLFAKKQIINDDITKHIQNNQLLFINLGLIGDLILFRYVIEDFLKLNYKITILIQDKYKFLFENLSNNEQIDIITVSNYKDKKIIQGVIKIYRALRQNKKCYTASLHFRGYLGTGILSTYIASVSQNLIGYGTSGFGFLLNHRVKWQENAHETIHLLDVLRVIEPNYSFINLNVFSNYLINCNSVLNKYGLENGEYIIIHAISQDAKKNIPEHTLSATVQYILDNTNQLIVFVGLANEIQYIKDSLKLNDWDRVIFTNGVSGFFDVYCLLSKARMFIGVDSSIAHLSSGVSIHKMIIWHSLNLLEQWRPLGDNIRILMDSTPKFVVKSIACYLVRRSS